MESGNELIRPQMNEPVVDKPSVDETIKSRIEQPKIDRLCEYITGLKIDDPKLMDKLEEDHKMVRSKYYLPDLKVKFRDLSEYELRLRIAVQELESEVIPSSDFGGILDKNKNTNTNHRPLGAYSRRTGKIGVDIEKGNRKAYNKSLVVLEHERIHLAQHKRYPDMEIEKREYEAYIAVANMNNFRKLLDNDSLSYFFKHVQGSVNSHYEQKSKSMEVKITPKWDNPEYFLKNVDGISDEQIKEYKDKHQVVDIQKQPLGFVGDSVK